MQIRGNFKLIVKKTVVFLTLFLTVMGLLYGSRQLLEEYFFKSVAATFKTPFSATMLANLYWSRVKHNEALANYYTQIAFKGYLDDWEQSKDQKRRAEAAFAMGLYFKCGAGFIKKDLELSQYWLKQADNLGVREPYHPGFMQGVNPGCKAE